MSFIARFLYSFRKLNHPIKRGDLVIDIGSGGNIHPKAHVACDLYSDNLERGTPLTIDRPFVWANAENLPFKNKVFGFSLLSHVLEHSFYPEKIISELQRISHGGYIETPAAWQEFAVPFHYHVSFVSNKNHTLFIHMKNKWDQYEDNKTLSLIMDEIKQLYTYFIKEKPRFLNTYYTWKDVISYDITKPCEDHEWEKIKSEICYKENKYDLYNDFRRIMKKLVLFILKPRIKFLINDLLCCPYCHAELQFKFEISFCKGCRAEFAKKLGYWDFTKSVNKPQTT